MKKVITYGTYDLITAGHIEHFRDAKAMGDYLIVGVSTDEFNAIKNKKSYLTYEERKFLVESIKYVDEVIPETHWEQKTEDIKKYDISIVAMGSDWEGDERFERLREFCDVKYTYRTGKYSSTNFRKHVEEYVDEKENKYVIDDYDFNDTVISSLISKEFTEVIYIADTKDEIVKKIKATKQLLYPVVDNGKLIGAVYLKELLSQLKQDKDLKDIVKTVLYFDKDEKANDVFSKMQKEHENFAIITKDNNYYGVITSKCALDEIINSI